MRHNKKRKEVVLDEETIELLEFKAKKAGRNLKNYMEFILVEKAAEIEFQNEAKALEIKMALIKSRKQSDRGLIKQHQQIINDAKIKVNAHSVDKAS